MNKIVVVVDGGVVVNVHSTDPATKVEIIDHDNLREESSWFDREEIEKSAIKGLVKVY